MVGDIIENLRDMFTNLNYLDYNILKPDDTVLINIDIINGFVKEGNLYSERIGGMVPKIIEYNRMFKNFQRIYIRDNHHSDSLEFQYFPVHGIGEESQLIDELNEFMDNKATIVTKNSTNGFLARRFGEWLNNNYQDISNYILIGDCTDICILQFALSIKAFYNQWDIDSRVIVPVDCVETYDHKDSLHDAEIMNLFALYNMYINGVQIVKGISK